MAFTHLLDTSVYSQPLKRLPLESVIERWKRLGDHSLCISIVCEAEILQELELKRSKKLWEAYDTILKDRLPMIHIDPGIARVYAKIQALSKENGKTRPVFDLLIASTALSHNLILATCNYKDFEDIEGLRLEDWSIPL